MPNTHVLTQDQYYDSYYLKPKYLIIGYIDPLGRVQGSMFYRLQAPGFRV